MRTGGGDPPQVVDVETVKILSIISDDLVDVGNELDSDTVQSKSYIQGNVTKILYIALYFFLKLGLVLHYLQKCKPGVFHLNQN